MARSLVLIKKSIADHLQQLIDTQQGLNLSWKCNYCHNKHSGNMLKKVKKAEAGYEIESFKPDMTLFDEQQQVFAVIQLSTKQKPDAVAIQFYEAKGIIYMQVKLEPQDELESLKAKLVQPDFVGTCFNPKCKECNHFLQKTIMTIIEEDCYKCKHPMKVAVIEAGMSRGGTCVGPESFTPTEIELARSKGVLIEPVFSKTRQERYLANICPGCNTFVGQHYLFTDYLSPAGMGYLKHETHQVGYYCDYCSEGDWV
jgi:hypothetical protein